MQVQAELGIQAYLAAVRKLIDPNRSMLFATSPYVVGGSAFGASRKLLIAGARAAHGADADYIHLDFAPGDIAAGPANVGVGMIRATTCAIRTKCRFWLAENGTPFLVATSGPKLGTMSFAPDGMDSRPGGPAAGDLEEGYARATARLRALAAEVSAYDRTIRITLPRAA